jgi:hypothetical protein
MFQPLRLGGEGQALRQALQLVGKLEITGRLNAVAPRLLIYINDQLTGRRFLVETGAAFSILPHHSSDPATGQGLTGPSGSPIRCWGGSAVKLKLAGQHFTWSFLLADVSTETSKAWLSTSRSAPSPFPRRISWVAAIQKYPRPATGKQPLAFLGVFNFYRQFVPVTARILRPLTNSTRGSPKATAAVDWTPPMVAAFDATRTTLGAAALLAHPQQDQQDQELAVMVDASADHVGAALQQRRSAAADWQPLAFFS